MRRAAAIAAIMVPALFPLCAGAAAPKAKPQPGPVTILDGSSVWRVLYSWAATPIQTKDGVAERRFKPKWRQPTTEFADYRFMTLYPPDGWTAADFDDSAWARQHFYAKYVNGETDPRAGGGAQSPFLRQQTLRGKFTMTDPAKAQTLRLTVGFRGGAAVYVNGTELTRSHLPKGQVAPGSPAEMYPKSVYLKPDGKPWNWYSDRQKVGKASYAHRVRKIDGLAVPAKLLRKGTNVLAVELHAAPYPEEFTARKMRPMWATCGLIELRLQADRAEGVEPNVLRPKGLQVWNANLIEHVRDIDWGDPHETLRPIKLAGAKNGTYTGRVIVSSDRAIKGLKAELDTLTSRKDAKIPAESVRISYGAFSGAGAQAGYLVGHNSGLWTCRDDGLVNAPPTAVPVAKKTLTRWYRPSRIKDGLPPALRDGAVQPVYLTVRVPKDTAPGEYRGALTITVEGQEPVKVPVQLDVIDWTLPDPKDFTYWFGLIQSPEGVGLRYGVPLWSAKHLELMGKSFEWIAQVGSKVLFIPIGAEGEYGNEHSMVLWIKGRGGYTHDFSRVEKYVDLALKHIRPRFVVVGVWHFREYKKAPRISVLDPATHKITNIDGPTHGTPESLALWKPVLTKVKAILDERGLGGAMLYGWGSDRYPTKQTATVFHTILPSVGWMAARHPPRGGTHIARNGGGVPVMYTSNVWGCGDVRDPATRRVYGWNFKYSGAKGGLRTWLDRGIYDPAALVRFRGMSENILLSDRPGQGQIGADFWPPKPAKGRRPLGSLYNRYPRSRNAGGGNKACTTNQLLYPGADGAVPTLRFENVRENIQECEARIFLEKLLVAKRLPAGLAKKCQDMLDERTRWERLQGVGSQAHISWPYSGWERRTAKLYQTAAEAAKALAN